MFGKVLSVVVYARRASISSDCLRTTEKFIPNCKHLCGCGLCNPRFHSSFICVTPHCRPSVQGMQVLYLLHRKHAVDNKHKQKLGALTAGTGMKVFQPSNKVLARNALFNNGALCYGALMVRRGRDRGCE